MAAHSQYEYLIPKAGSRYRQLFVNGRIMAEILYRQTIGTEALTPEEVAKEYSLPVEAILEAVHYCEHNQQILDEDRRSEDKLIKLDGRNRWPHAPRDYKPHE